MVAFTLIIIGGWLFFTPPGLLGKADAIAYAVCHRIPERSFFMSERQLPLCARCTGMYLGAFIGFVYQFRFGKRAKLPSLKVLITMSIFAVAFVVDGINSYLHFFPNLPSLYNPQNWLRLLTGTGLGLGMSVVLVPVFNQTVWSKVIYEPAVETWRHLFELILLGGCMVALVLSQNPLILYPLALIGPATVLLILTMVYAMVWLMITKNENRFQDFKELWVPLTSGFLTAILQIALMDMGRYILTGTWSGFEFKSFAFWFSLHI